MRPSFMEQVGNRAQERSHLSLPAQVGKLPRECHVLLGHASLKSTFPGLCPSRYWMKGVAPQVSILSIMSFQVSGREAGSLPSVFPTALLQCCPEPFDIYHTLFILAVILLGHQRMPYLTLSPATQLSSPPCLLQVTTIRL